MTTAEQANGAMPQALLAALHYASSWSVPVLPDWWRLDDGSCGCPKGPLCKSPGKHPMIDAWSQEATTSETTIRAWWDQWPRARVGIRTGGRLGVIDVDPRHDGVASLERLEREQGPLPVGPRVVTGSGGWHLYFRLPDGAKLKSVSPAFGPAYPGVDTRGDGGQVVAPGSDGYSWDAERGLLLRMPELPAWVLTMVNGRPSERLSAGAAPVGERIADGARNQTLTSLAGTMRRRGMGEAEIAAALHVTNRDRCVPPLDDREVDGIAHSIAGYAPAQGESANVSSPAVGNFVFLSAEDFFAPETAADLVVPALGIGAGPPTGLVGQAYVGKTIVALSSGLSVATGKDLWGHWTVQRGVWVHLDYEQGRRHTKTRILRLARGMGVADDELRALLVDGQIRISIFPDVRLTTEGASDHFRRIFEGVRLVTCDSLRMMLGNVDENSSQVRSLMGALTSASDATRAAVGLIHHGGKTPTDSERPRKETPRGSSGIIDEFQSMFVLTKKKGDEVAYATHEKDRELGFTVEDFGLRIEDVTAGGNLKGGLRVVHFNREQLKPSADAKAKFSALQQKVLECIRDNPGIAGVAAVAQTMGGGEHPIRAAVQALMVDGRVVERKTGQSNGRRLYLAHAVPPEGAS